MKHLPPFSELRLGQVIIAQEDIFKSIGGPIYCLKGTRLTIRKLFPGAFKACPEGEFLPACITIVGTTGLRQFRIP